MASALRRVALVGASGRLGPFLLRALQAEPGFDVTVVTRYSSKAEFPKDTKVVNVADGYPITEMTEVFKGQDAVVLSLGYPAEHLHASLAEASIKAGVKHLIASAWGGSTSEGAQKIFPIAAGKAKIIAELKAMETPGWSWTAICCGLFFDFSISFTNMFGSYDKDAHTARIWDSGNQKFSATNLPTIGLALTKVLAKPEETANREVYVSSFECSMNDILGAYKKATGVDDWDITYTNTDEQIKSATEAMMSGSGNPMMAMGTLAFASEVKEGLGGDFAAAGLSDNELLGIPRESVDDTVARVLKQG